MKNWNNIIKALGILYMVVTFVFTVWIIASWLNVGFNNHSTEAIQNIWSWNFFKLFF